MYIATMRRDKKNFQSRNYKQISQNTLKKQYENHKRSFNINKYRIDAKISVKYWNVKAGNSNPKVIWAVKD